MKHVLCEFYLSCNNKKSAKETFVSSLIKKKNALPWCCNDGGSDRIDSGASWPPQGSTLTSAPPPSSGGWTTHAQSGTCAAVPSFAAWPHPIYSEKSPDPEWRATAFTDAKVFFQECTMKVQHLTFNKPFSVSRNGRIISFTCWFSAFIFSYSNRGYENSTCHFELLCWSECNTCSCL